MGSHGGDDERCLSTRPGPPVTKAVVPVVLPTRALNLSMTFRFMGAQWLATGFVGAVSFAISILVARDFGPDQFGRAVLRGDGRVAHDAFWQIGNRAFTTICAVTWRCRRIAGAEQEQLV